MVTNFHLIRFYLTKKSFFYDYVYIDIILLQQCWLPTFNVVYLSTFSYIYLVFSFLFARSLGYSTLNPACKGLLSLANLKIFFVITKFYQNVPLHCCNLDKV